MLVMTSEYEICKCNRAYAGNPFLASCVRLFLDTIEVRIFCFMTLRLVRIPSPTFVFPNSAASHT